MRISILPNTQAILLLTAPLLAGRGEPSPDLLLPSEYNRLERLLIEKQQQPADLLTPDSQELLKECQHLIDSNRLKRLLDRGFLLSQVIEHWQTRAIWVMSRTDAEYPRQLKTRLKDDAPPILYGCGEATILETGGLAVVGSRYVDDTLVEYTEGIGQLVAKARRTLISGGARGIDKAAMRGALEGAGKVVGILADSLEQAALNRENRDLLMDGQLVLISPYDPIAGFNVGHAMQRNKLIYALADAALVVSAEYKQGGTWAGAIEQLQKRRLVPVYVRSNGKVGRGLEALQSMGALPWPNPDTPEALAELLLTKTSFKNHDSLQSELRFSIQEESNSYEASQILSPVNNPPTYLSVESPLIPADELFAKVRDLVVKMKMPMTDSQLATDLQVSKSQAKQWLQRLVNEGIMEKHTKPIRYGLKSQRSLLE
jgi:predicted Rossmann fold nucleotide-binding protein DprA/Smf involved in DNA uptake